MAQNAGVVAGSRWTDLVSLGVLASSVPRDVIDDAVVAAGRQARRSDGKLPPHVMVYFAMAMALFAGDDYEEVASCGVPEVCMRCDLRRRPGQSYGIMITRVFAPALPHLRPGLRLDSSPRPVIGLQERRAARAAARGRRAAPRQPPAPARLGRPSGPRRAHPAPAGEAADAPAGHPWHRPAVAPSPDRPQVDLPEPSGAACGQHRDRRADRAARDREPRLGIPANPR